jgi:arylsulfatase A-like enzyme
VLFEHSWETLEHRPDAPPKVRKLRPLPKADERGHVRMGLSMPPPCVTRFEVRAEDCASGHGLDDGPARLFTAAGVHHTALDPDALGHVRFQVDVNDELVFDERITLASASARNRWLPVGGEDGLAVPPGAVVTLRTELIDADVEPDDPILAGFATLELRRTRTKPALRATPTAPNVVLIVMDTLRADRLECYGYQRPTSPRLNALAERGTLFEQAYGTSSWTWPSTASILTGLWPETHGVTSVESCYLAGELETLPEVLSARGYRTAAFTCNPLIVRNKNFDQGFDTFEDGNIPGFLQRGFANTHKVEGEILDWLDTNRDARFFLYLHLVDTHWPYDPRPEARELLGELEVPDGYPKRGLEGYQARMLADGAPTTCGQELLDERVPPSHQEWMRARYDGAVRSADVYVGHILDRLNALGLDESTVVLFTSDHGEELCDHGMPAHGFALYEEHVRVPLILAGPGVPAGQRVSTPVSSRHIAPTLAWLGGTELAAVHAPLDLLDPARIDERPVFFSTQSGIWCGHNPLPTFGVRQGDHVWIRMLGAGPWGVEADATGHAAGNDEGLLLFDLARDPAQRTNLWRDRSEETEALASRLGSLLSEHVESATRARSVGAVAADSATMRILRDVGYVGNGE